MIKMILQFDLILLDHALPVGNIFMYEESLDLQARGY